MNYSVIVLAAGKGVRANLGYNKVLFYMQKHNNTILGKTLEFFASDSKCTQIILVCSPADIEDIKANYSNEKTQIVLGGNRRQDSVYNGLQYVTQDYVLVHDGNRPFVSSDIIDRILISLQSHEAVLVAIPVKDTIKEITKDGYVSKTLDQKTLMAAQTPQAFKTNILKDAYQKVIETDSTITDDVSAIELFQNAKVFIVEGHHSNEKITYKDDFIDL